MNRKVKNLIIILVIIVMIGLSFITINSAKNSIQNTSNVASSSQNGMGTPPEMPSGSEQGSQNQMNNSQTPPEMPNQSGANGVFSYGGSATTNNSSSDGTTVNISNSQSTTYKNVFLYQSMSGDASTGTATFTTKKSNITTNNGDSFYITNTIATINLSNNTIINNDTTGNFLRAQKDSCGTTGSNGGNVTLNMTSQTAKGNIVIDSISTLAMKLETESYYEGTINSENTAKEITLKLDSTSKIKLTGDSYITTLEDADTTYSNIDFNGYTLYVNGIAVNK